MLYEHLKFSKELPLTDRRRSGFKPPFVPDNPREFGINLQQNYSHVKQIILEDEIPGYDPRLLLKFILRKGEQLPALDKIPGVQIISQEEKQIVLAFLNEGGLAEFESRLTSLATDGEATRKEILYALENFDRWSPDDRTGAALREFGLPDTESFIIDVELWPEEHQKCRKNMMYVFINELKKRGIEVLDQIQQPSLLMLRIRSTSEIVYNVLLQHQDVRTVDLPPRSGITIQLVTTGIESLPIPKPPKDNAPSIAVLDSGITSNHPLLLSAVGDAQGYIESNHDAADRQPWHGTFVAGLALYGDVAQQLRAGQFTPSLRLFSGKVFRNDGSDQTVFVENAVDKAVRELHSRYECKIFNLSYGDLNKVYDGRHLRGLGYTLDRLSRELGILFVVPTGNVAENQIDSPKENYPRYLLHKESRLLDPATAINALTIGGLTSASATFRSQLNQNTIEDVSIAIEKQPFPLTRSGPSVNDAIKPDLVEPAGNIAIMRSGGQTTNKGLGILSLNGNFASGLPFSEDIGTSYAAPQAAHKAANILTIMPNASANLLRSLMGVHAHWPTSSCMLLNKSNSPDGRELLRRLCGYGQTDAESLAMSSDKVVSLFAEDRINKDKCHFYEIPTPESFWSGGKRTRKIGVALAYTPEVRTTRLDYRMTKLWYNFVEAFSLDEVVRVFQRNGATGIGERDTRRWITNQERRNGSLQVSRWEFVSRSKNEKKLFVVVTRQDTNWSTMNDDPESYALAVVLDDRENSNAELYGQVRAELQARDLARLRARV